MTLKWQQQEDADIWTAMAGNVSISIYRGTSVTDHWFSVGMGLPPMFLGNGSLSTMNGLQEAAALRLRRHLIEALEAMGCEVMCWERGNAAEAASVLGGRELRELAMLADVARLVPAQTEAIAVVAGITMTPKPLAAMAMRKRIEQRLLSGEPATWYDLKPLGDSDTIDEVIHELRMNRQIEINGQCPKNGVAIWLATKR